MEEKFGSIDAAKHAPVLVSTDTHSVTCILKDRMPHRWNIHNGALIDLNPAACAALNLTPPVMTRVTWRWAT